MTNVLKEKVIIPSWELIRQDSALKKFYLFPGILSIIFLTFLLVYQVIYTYVEIFEKKKEALVLILQFFHSDYIIEFAIVWVIFLIIYFLLTPIFEWALIKYIENKSKWEEISASDAFWLWLYKFFPLFEYNNIFSEFKFISVLNFYLFSIRFVGIEYISTLSYIFVIVLLFSILINILFAYSKYFIVIENKKVFESIWLSSKVTILNLKHTIKLYFLMFFLNIRVIFNFIIFLSFPIIMAVSIWLITSKIYLTIAISILSLIFIFFIVILWYLTAVLDILKTSIWFYAYKEWKTKLEQVKED